MKILFLSDCSINPTKGGVERVTSILTHEFEKMGHKVRYFTFPDYSESTPGEAVIAARGFRPDVVINQSATNKGLRVAEALKGEGLRIFSVLHNQPFPYSGVERDYRRNFKPTSLGRQIMKIAGLFCPRLFGRWRHIADSGVYSRLLALSEKLVVLSPHYCERLRRMMPSADLSRIVAIPNPVSFKPVSEGSKEKMVLWIGRHSDPQKNGKAFIRAWKIFSTTHPEWRGVMAGEGPQHLEYKRFAASLGVTDLEFPGSVDDVQPLYAKASVLAMTSLYEGWPMVIPEAMVHGCVPVVFDSFEALGEILGSPSAGISVGTFTPEAFAEALGRVADDSELLECMRKRARDERPEWSPENVAARWIALMKGEGQ